MDIINLTFKKKFGHDDGIFYQESQQQPPPPSKKKSFKFLKKMIKMGISGKSEVKHPRLLSLPPFPILLPPCDYL